MSRGCEKGVGACGLTCALGTGEGALLLGFYVSKAATSGRWLSDREPFILAKNGR